jgi:copper chaperone
MATTTFTVEQIHCGACEDAIRKALTRLDGVREVSADAATNRIDVTYDDGATSDAAIAERLETAGYPVVD